MPKLNAIETATIAANIHAAIEALRQLEPPSPQNETLIPSLIGIYNLLGLKPYLLGKENENEGITNRQIFDKDINTETYIKLIDTVKKIVPSYHETPLDYIKKEKCNLFLRNLNDALHGFQQKQTPDHPLPTEEQETNYKGAEDLIKNTKHAINRENLEDKSNFLTNILQEEPTKSILKEILESNEALKKEFYALQTLLKDGNTQPKRPRPNM